MKSTFRDYSAYGNICFLLAEDLIEFVEIIDLKQNIKYIGDIFLN